MTRYRYPSSGGASSVINGAGKTITIYRDAAFTTLADITDMSGNVLAGSTLTLTAFSIIPDFYGPDNYADVLYGKVGINPHPLPITRRVTVTGYQGLTAKDIGAAPLSDPIVQATSGTQYTVMQPADAAVTALTLNANATLTLPSPVAGQAFTLVLTQDSNGSRTVTWPGNIKWEGGYTPILTPTALKSDVFSFLCVDGATWLAFVSAQGM